MLKGLAPTVVCDRNSPTLQIKTLYEMRQKLQKIV